MYQEKEGVYPGRLHYGATDSILCPAEFQTPEAPMGSLETTWQDHPLQKRRDKEVCLSSNERRGI
jgi:hypothetical protein